MSKGVYGTFLPLICNNSDDIFHDRVFKYVQKKIGVYN